MQAKAVELKNKKTIDDNKIIFRISIKCSYFFINITLSLRYYKINVKFYLQKNIYHDTIILNANLKITKINMISALSEYYKQISSLYDNNSIYLKGILFKYENKYYPIKTIFLPIFKNDNDKPDPFKIIDYKSFLFISGILKDANSLFENFKGILKFNEKLSFLHFSANLSQEINSIFQNIQELNAYERNIEEEKDTLLKKLEFYSPLKPQEISIIRENCSYPLLKFKEYPSHSRIYYLKIDNKIKNAFNKILQQYEPLIPVNTEHPLFPDYYSAAKYYIGKENLLLNDWTVIYSDLDFRAKINKITINQNKIKIDINKKINLEIKVKYYIEYENGEQIADSFNFSEHNYIDIDSNLTKLYIWIFEINNLEIPIDYRKYDWSMPFKDPLTEYLVTEYESFNFNLMFSGESEMVEYKLDLDRNTGNKEFLETVCSFSNSINGGYIFLGIDDNMNCKGIKEYKIKSYKQSIEDSIRNHMDPQSVEFEINERDYSGKKILEVRIYGGKSKPYCIKDVGYYIRVKATDRMPTHDEITSLMLK